jgi:hypothetical protein
VSQIHDLKAEAAVLIAQLDAVISTVRAYWLEASPNSKERRHWMIRMHELLDQRLHLMRLRDSSEHRVASSE